MTANMVPISDSVPALRGKSVNQPPSGARRRTEADGDRGRDHQDEDSAATQMRTAIYFSRHTGFTWG